MKKISLVVFALGILLLGSIGVASAETTIWTQVDGYGHTEYEEQTTTSGWDWSEGMGATYSEHGWEGYNPCGPTLQTTAFVSEGFVNDGEIHMFEAKTNYGEWQTEGVKYIHGEGDTNLYKYAEFWTEDSRYNDEGKLWWPSEAWVETDFRTDTLWDAQSFHAIMDIPKDDESEHASFYKVIDTDDEFDFAQKVGINNFPSDYVIPEIPEFPEMHYIY